MPGEAAASGEGEETRRVYVYDVSVDKYWAAFDYQHTLRESSRGRYLSPVQLAGTSLSVWSEGQLRRMGLDGNMGEEVLLKHWGIREFKVSPDGTKVMIILYGSTLLVLDTVTGEKLLCVAGSNPLLAPLTGGVLNVGRWHADGSALSVTGGTYPIPHGHSHARRGPPLTSSPAQSVAG